MSDQTVAQMVTRKGFETCVTMHGAPIAKLKPGNRQHLVEWLRLKADEIEEGSLDETDHGFFYRAGQSAAAMQNEAVGRSSPSSGSNQAK